MTFKEWYKAMDIRLSHVPNFDPVTKEVKQLVVARMAWNAAVREMVKQEDKTKRS